MRDVVELVEACLEKIGGGRGARYILAWLVQVDSSAITLWLQGKRELTAKNRERLEQIFEDETIEISLKPITRLLPKRSDPSRASPPKRAGGAGGQGAA